MFLILLSSYLGLNLHFFQALNLLFFHKITDHTLEGNHKDRAIHEVHSASKQHALGSFVSLRGRWKHLEARTSHALSRDATAHDASDAFAATNRYFSARARR